jgi:hypothetical protein
VHEIGSSEGLPWSFHSGLFLSDSLWPLLPLTLIPVHLTSRLVFAFESVAIATSHGYQ